MTAQSRLGLTESLYDASRRSRVLIVSDAAPHRNGVGAYYQDLMHYLSPRVEAIDIISPEIVDGEWQGGWMLPLPGDRTQKFCIPNLIGLRRRIESFAPDVVVIPTPGPFGVLGARYAAGVGARVVVGFHTWYEKLTELYWNRVQGSLTRGFFEVSNRLIFRYADVVLANSESMVDIARRIGAPQAALMGTPVSAPFLERPAPRAPTRVGTVLFAGRLAAEKNIDSMIQAARDLPDVRFSIAGDGPLRVQVEEAATQLPNLQYIGWLTRDGLMDAIDSHDLLMLPSHVESFGTIALEAMARQRLVVVSAHCGIADWPDLAEHLTVIPEHATLGQVLNGLKALSEFELNARARQCRQAVLSHNDWNTRLWSSFVSEAP
ncbi:glycosyltransferase [Saccharospirillum salsuginis]|uniref:Glycosyl transferase n=1 Tax=Saccharospirillum salsuginis TaxID=418750 RepID=A0A918N4H9_9GAMM|nr:glycosyltransferase [Saccharospirillum salsuginis]GGX38216.1 glycosyl transferase [Saccharospirillum salsuginis]